MRLLNLMIDFFMSIHSQKNLEIVLSKLEKFSAPSLPLEQYATPEHIAAEWIWTMVMRKEVLGKIILDAACGPGILGLGLLLMGAKKVFFVDKDKIIMAICQKNYQKLAEEYEMGTAEFIAKDIIDFNTQVDVVVQNPPFGTKNKHIDKTFLEKAFIVAPVAYSMHKYSTKGFVEALSKDRGFNITHVWRFDFPIKAAFTHHRKPVVKVDVGLWRMEKSKV